MSWRAHEVDPTHGLQEHQIAQHAQTFGANELPGSTRRSLSGLVLEQFSDFMILVQSWRAEQALAALQRLSRAQATVLRSGQVQQVPALALVPGDIVLLEAGNHVPADLRLAAFGKRVALGVLAICTVIFVVGVLRGEDPLMGVFAWAIASGHSHGQTMVFTVLTLGQIAHVMAIRSETDPFWRLGLTSNRPLLGSVLLTLGLQMATIYVPVLNPIFKTQPLSAFDLALCLAAKAVP